MRFAAFFAVLLLACAPDVGPVTESRVPLLSANGLTPAELEASRDTLRCLAAGPLSTARLEACGVEEGPTLSTTAYVVRCALLPSDNVLAPDGSSLSGSLGIATTWRGGGCGSTCQRKVTACLLAHVNALAVPTPISVSGHGLLARSDEERAAYSRREGAFFGNLFAAGNQAYACASDALLGSVLQTRLCSTSLCFINLVGLCGPGLLGACEAESPGNDPYLLDCHPLLGPTYGEVVTTWLTD